MDSRRLRCGDVILGLGTIAALLIPEEGAAKLSAAPGKDGAPPDPQTEAEVAALNEALEAPEEGESWEHWLAKVEAAHDALYGPASQVSVAVPEVSCNIVEDSLVEGCDGDDTWATLGEPYNVVLSKTTQCPYDNYVECLQAGETVDFCKRRVLNCHPGELTTAGVTVDFDARQCVDEPICLCARAQGAITFYGVTVVNGDETCLYVSDFDYDGPFKGQAEAGIEEKLDEYDWLFCLPSSCL